MRLATRTSMRNRWVLLVPPLPHVGDAREQQREPERERPLVEALLAAADAHRAVVVDRAVDVDGEVLVGAEVVDDRAALLLWIIVASNARSRAAKRNRRDQVTVSRPKPST